MFLNKKDLLIAAGINIFLMVLLFVSSYVFYPPISCGWVNQTKPGFLFGFLALLSFLPAMFYYFCKNKFEIDAAMAITLILVGVTIVSMLTLVWLMAWLNAIFAQPISNSYPYGLN